jgi:parvulin-like peptidyl-prolyl isomerase
MPRYQTRRKKNSITSITTWRKFAVHRIIYLGLAGIFGLGMVAYFSTGMPGAGGRGAATEREASTVVTVNGEPVTRAEYDQAWELQRRMAGGSEIGSVLMQGQILRELVDNALLRSIAKKQGITVSDEEVDKAIESMRQSLGSKNNPASDDRLLEIQGAPSMNVLREDLRRQLLPRTLFEKFAARQQVTEEDLRKSYDQVKARHILIAVTDSPRPIPGALPDAMAKRRAEKILTEVKAGKDFAQLANEFTMDPTNKMDPATGKPVPPKGGEMGWRPYGDIEDPAFANAARALKKGEVSGVVKTPNGYEIIQVEDTRTNLPQDYARRKGELLRQLRQQRAQKPFMDMVETARKSARIVWQAPDLKWRYDFARLGGGMMMLGGETQQNEDRFINELRKYYKDNPDDAAAGLVLGQELYYKKYLLALLPPPGKNTVNPSAPNPERDKLRAEIIADYASALKRTEDQTARMTLARLYEESKQPAKALEQYKKIANLLSWPDAPPDKTTHEQLEQAFQKLGAPDLAAKERKKIDELTAQELKERKEKAAEEAKVKAAQKAAQEKAARDKEAQQKAVQEKNPGAEKQGSRE